MACQWAVVSGHLSVESGQWMVVYLDRIAITGSILAATQAGIIPERIPIKLEINKPVTIFFIDNTNGKASCGIRVNKTTKPIPTKPPIKLKKTASNRNWNRMK